MKMMIMDIFSMSPKEVDELLPTQYLEMSTYASSMIILRRSHLMNKDKKKGGKTMNVNFGVPESEFQVKEEDKNFFSKIIPRNKRKKE